MAISRGAKQTIAPRTGRPVPSSTTVPWTTTPRFRDKFDRLLDRPLGPFDCLLSDQIGLALGSLGLEEGSIGPHRKGGSGGPEASLSVGLVPEVADRDCGVRRGAAGVGIGHLPGNGPRRQQRDRNRLWVGAGLDPDCQPEGGGLRSIRRIGPDDVDLRSVSRAIDEEAVPRASAQPVQRESPLLVALRRAGPAREVVPRASFSKSCPMTAKTCPRIA